MPNEIRFYRVQEPYGCFSNFSPHPIVLDGVTWPTSEHYFQAQKFADPNYQGRIAMVKSPMIAARMGRSRSQPLRADWEQVKDDIMRKAVRAKVMQHSDVRETLLSTGDAVILEATSKDKYWGEGEDGHREKHARQDTDGSAGRTLATTGGKIDPKICRSPQKRSRYLDSVTAP